MSEVECPCCKGSGETTVFHNTGTDYRKHFATSEKCDTCNGTGKTSIEQAEKLKKRIEFWDNLLNKATWNPTS